MRIAQIAPIIESVPPKKYGGTERVIYALTEELVKRGHDVTLFASGDSHTSANLASVFPVALRKAHIKNIYGHNIWSLMNVGMAYEQQEEFDIIHDHNSQNNPISLPLAHIAATPVVMTLHGPLTNGLAKPFEFYTNPYLVAISGTQRQSNPNLNYIGTVHHGLDMKDYPYRKHPKNYLLFVGRVSIASGIEEKGLLHAITVAERLDMKLLIAAKIDDGDPKNMRYFNEVIKPHFSSKIRWLGEVDEAQRNKLMSEAYCLLHPVNFPEPFGLTLIEALACGCPVVGFGKGSIPEIIQDRKTGFVVETVSQMIESVKKIPGINRLYCRSYALELFSVAKMTSRYEAIYNRIIDLHKNSPRIIANVTRTVYRKHKLSAH